MTRRPSARSRSPSRASARSTSTRGAATPSGRSRRKPGADEAAKHDATRRRRSTLPAADELRLMAEAFRASAYAISIHDARTNTLVAVNDAYTRLLGASIEDLLGRRVLDLYLLADRERVARCLRNADERGATHFEATLLAIDGALQPVEVSLHVIRERNRPRYRIATLRSTKRRLETEASRQAAYERIRALSQRLGSAQETERKRVANALHEGLMQSLAAANLGLERVRQMLAAPVADVAEAQALLHSVQDQIRGMTDDAREQVHALRPTGLEHLGLWPVLAQHVERWSAGSGVRATLDLRARPTLSADVALAGFRAVQECLSNVARHARAKHVVVASRRDGRTVEIVVEDDGIGLLAGDFEKPDATGLLGATERAIAVGGELRTARRRPNGTRIVVRLPCARRPPTGAKKARGGEGAREA